MYSYKVFTFSSFFQLNLKLQRPNCTNMILSRVLRSAYKIQCLVNSEFEPVRRMFEKNFIDKVEAHAQLCVYVGDEKVIDLSGTRDESVNYDSLTNVFSSTKNLTPPVYTNISCLYLKKICSQNPSDVLMI